LKAKRVGTPQSESAQRVWEGVAAPPAAMRADKYLSDVLKLMTRSQLKARGAHLFCNDKPAKFSCALKAGDRVRLEWMEAPSEEILPEPIPLALLYQDDDVFVIDKPQGMVTHPAAGNWSGTLANGVLWLAQHTPSAVATPPAENPPRAGIVHRLDKDTSGVIIVARTAAAHEFLARQFRDRIARKEYIAIVRGVPSTEIGRIDTWLARSPRDRKKFSVSAEGHGKRALTLYRVRAVWTADSGAKASSKASSKAPSTYSLLSLYPRTGRTHQLRVHCAHIGCPILGDPIYGTRDPRFPDATLMLHAHMLKIALPSDGEPRVFRAPIPSRFRAFYAMISRFAKKTDAR